MSATTEPSARVMAMVTFARGLSLSVTLYRSFARAPERVATGYGAQQDGPCVSRMTSLPLPPGVRPALSLKDTV